MKLKGLDSCPNQKPQDQPSVEDYQSWDPFTQAKFIYEINKQAGTPVSVRSAYETALEGIREDE